MNPHKGLVLDANILLRAVLGRRVGELLQTYENAASFYSPDVCFADACRYLGNLLEKRGRDPATGLVALDQLRGTVQLVEHSLYGDYEQVARERIQLRDPDDWPVVAVALLLDLPIWTEDQDLFGSGVATWTTDRVEVFLRQSLPCVLKQACRSAPTVPVWRVRHDFAVEGLRRQCRNLAYPAGALRPCPGSRRPHQAQAAGIAFVIIGKAHGRENSAIAG